MTTISSTAILRSQHSEKSDHILSTMLCRYPRWIHAEGRTHRLLRIGEEEEIDWAPRTPALMEDPMLSRNASSSRAIPVRKLIDDVIADPAVPLFWGKNVGGMQAREELPQYLAVKARDAWMRAMESAIAHAQELAHLADDEDDRAIGCHKQIVNRLLEPFSHITVVVSATEWSNFFALRDHSDAEPHIRLLAQRVKEAMAAASPQISAPEEWHWPFVDRSDWDEIWSRAAFGTPAAWSLATKLSVARCASTSYKTVDGFDMTIERAVELHDKLVGSQPLHASPCEHVAQADEFVERQYRNGKRIGWQHSAEHGNFVGFRQYRKMLPGEHIGGPI